MLFLKAFEYGLVLLALQDFSALFVYVGNSVSRCLVQLLNYLLVAHLHCFFVPE